MVDQLISPVTIEPEFHPQYAGLPVSILLSSAVSEEVDPILGVTVTYHPNLLYSWVVGNEYESGYGTAEEAKQDAIAINGLEKFSASDEFPVLVDGLVQYLAYLDSCHRDDRNEFFLQRVQDLSHQYAHGIFQPSEGIKLGYRWTPIPVWELPPTPLRGAVLQHKTLRITYTNLGDGMTYTRVVEPHYVFDARTTGNRCLLSWCRLRSNWRCFITNRINLLNVGKKFNFEEHAVHAEVEEALYKASQIAQQGPLEVELL